jgi:hypothetical protein
MMMLQNTLQCLELKIMSSGDGRLVVKPISQYRRAGSYAGKLINTSAHSGVGGKKKNHFRYSLISWQYIYADKHQNLMRKITLLVLCCCGLISACSNKLFHNGYYFDNDGKKVSGLITFQPSGDNFYYKAAKDADKEKIKLENIKALVMVRLNENDSLTVLTEGGNVNKKYFAKTIAVTPTTHLYYKFKSISSGGGMTMTQNPAPSFGPPSSTSHITYNYGWRMSPSYDATQMIPMYQDGNTTYQLTKGNFIKVLSKAFADVPDLVQQLQNKKIQV